MDIKKIKDSKFFETLMHSKNYLIAQVANAGLALISIPIFTSLYTQEEYGLYQVFKAYVSMFVPLISLNIIASVGRYYYEREEDFDQFLGTILVLLMSVFSFSFIFVLFNQNWLAGVMELPIPLIVLIMLNAGVILLSNLYISILVPQKQSSEVALIKTISTYLTIGLAIYWVSQLSDDKYYGQIYATILIGILMGVYYLYKLLPQVSITFKIKHLRYILSYSIPLLPYALSGIILSIFDRIMINSIDSSASAGLYSLGYNIALILSMVVTATDTAVTPEYFEMMEGKSFDRLDRLIARVQGVRSFIALGIVLFARELIVILADEKFHEAVVIIPWVVFGIIFSSLFSIYGRYIGYSKKTIYSSVIILIAGALNIVLNAIFIPQLGYIAAAYTTLVSYAVLFILAWTVVKVRFDYNTIPLQIVLIPTFGLIIISLVYLILLPFVSYNFFFVLIKTLIVLLFGIYLFKNEILDILNSK